MWLVVLLSVVALTLEVHSDLVAVIMLVSRFELDSV